MNEAGKIKVRKELSQILLSVIVSIMIAFIAVGCGNTSGTSVTTKTNATQNAATSRVTTTSATTTKTTTTSVATTKTTTTLVLTTAAGTTIKTTVTPSLTQGSPSTDPFVKMENALKSLGINYEKKWMYAEAIGAKEGNKYSTTKGTYEMYLYDMGSEAYKAAVTNNAMNLSGTLFPATIRAGLALYFYPNVTESVKNQILEVFFK
jgi:hypothetical protein